MGGVSSIPGAEGELGGELAGWHDELDEYLNSDAVQEPASGQPGLPDPFPGGIPTPGRWAHGRQPAPPPRGRTRRRQEDSELADRESLLAQARLPPGEDLGRWVARGTLHHLDLVRYCGVLLVHEACTEACCPRFRTGAEFHDWVGDGDPAAPLRLSGPHYVECVVNWAYLRFRRKTSGGQRRWEEEPAALLPEMRRLHRAFLLVYAHVYLHHLELWELRGVAAALDTAFHSWLLFVREFGLVDEQDLEPLRHVVHRLEPR